MTKKIEADEVQVIKKNPRGGNSPVICPRCSKGGVITSKELKEHITSEEYREYLRTGKLPERLGVPKESKYHNRRTNGYASKEEAKRAAELEILWKAGEIPAYMEQVPFRLQGGIVYKADFVILNADGTYTVEDVKGVKTDVYKLKKKLMKSTGLEIRET